MLVGMTFSFLYILAIILLSLTAAMTILERGYLRFFFPY